MAENNTAFNSLESSIDTSISSFDKEYGNKNGDLDLGDFADKEGLPAAELFTKRTKSIEVTQKLVTDFKEMSILIKKFKESGEPLPSKMENYVRSRIAQFNSIGNDIEKCQDGVCFDSRTKLKNLKIDIITSALLINVVNESKNVEKSLNDLKGEIVGLNGQSIVLEEILKGSKIPEEKIVSDNQIRGLHNLNVTKDLQKKPSQTAKSESKETRNKNLSELFSSYLGLEDNEFDEINLDSLIKNFDKIKGDDISDWIKNGYKSKNRWGLRGSEEKQINKIIEKYNTNPEFKNKIDEIRSGSVKNIQDVEDKGFRMKFVNSKYEVKKFSMSPEYVVNFIADVNEDGQIETKNRDPEWWKQVIHYLSLTLVDFDKIQGQNLSETLLKDELSSRMGDKLENFNKVLGNMGLRCLITPTTTPQQLKEIKKEFWTKLIEKMTMLGSNGKLDGFEQVLDGTGKEMLKTKLDNEEKLDKDINTILNNPAAEEQMNKRLVELKQEYGLDKVSNEKDLIRMKKILGGAMKQDPSSWNIGLFGGIIQTEGDKPKGGDLLGQLLKAVNMRKSGGVLGFYISKGIYQTEDKKGAINVGLANFIPYISAEYAFTLADKNRDKIGTAEKIEGNFTVVPFAALSPISATAGVDINLNDKNRAVNEEVAKVQELLNLFETKNDMMIFRNGNMIINRAKINQKFNNENDKQISVTLDKFFEKFMAYYTEYHIENDPVYNEKLFNHLRKSTLTYVTNELYKNNEGFNISGIKLGALISLINPATWASFIGLNFQSRTQKFDDQTEEERNKDKSRRIGESMRTVDAKELEKMGFKMRKTPGVAGKDGLTVYEYTGTTRNIYGGPEVEIEEVIVPDPDNKGKFKKVLWISGKIISIAELKSSDNMSKERPLVFNGKIGERSYKPRISTSLELRTITTTEEVKGQIFDDLKSDEKSFENKDKIKVLINKLFEKNNQFRYRPSFVDFQNEVAKMYNGGTINDAWCKLETFVDKLPKAHKKQLKIFIDSIKDSSEKQKIMMSILGLTAGDWRIRLFNELHDDTAWAKKTRRKLGLKPNFKMSDIKDGAYEVIDNPKIKRAEERNLVKYFNVSDKAKQNEFKQDFDAYSKEYDNKNNIKNQTDKQTKTEENAIVFVNFTQKNGSGKSTFHDVVPMYGDIELQKGESVTITQKAYKDMFVDKIPNDVMVSKFDQILTKIKAKPNTSNKHYNELLSKLEGISKDNAQKITLIRSALKGKTDIGLEGSFDLSFVRWSTCQNSAYMINNMDFKLEIPGYDIPKIETILPRVATGSINAPAVTRNKANEYSTVVTAVKSEGVGEGKGTTELAGDGSAGDGSGGTGGGGSTGNGR